MTKQKIDYAALQNELTQLTARLEEGDLEIDEAVSTYERGLEIIGELENLLKTAENRVSQLRAQSEAEQE